MKYSTKDAAVRRVDDVLTITDLFDGQDFSFDFVVAELSGDHPRLVNNVSDRAYFILDGSGDAYLGDTMLAVSKGDLVIIKAGTAHGLRGNLRYIIVTSPPFDPANEHPA